MNLFIKKLTTKLYLGAVTILVVFLASKLWDLVTSLQPVTLTILGTLTLGVWIYDSISEEKRNKWFRKK